MDINNETAITIFIKTRHINICIIYLHDLLDILTLPRSHTLNFAKVSTSVEEQGALLCMGYLCIFL